MKKLFIFFLFFFKYSKIFAQIIIPFKNNIDISKLTEENYIEKLFNLKITSNISIGTPYQEIPISIKLRQYNLIILSQDSKDGKNLISFNELNSSSFNTKDKSPVYFDLPEAEFIRRSNDKFKINNILIDNLNFFLSYDTVNNQSGCLGLKPVDSYNNYNLIYQLKQKKLINSYVFYFKFSSKNSYEGDIILGNFPHEIENKKFKNDLYGTISVINNKYITQQQYEFYISKIKIGEIEIAEKQIFNFIFETFFIQIPLNFSNYFENEFFKEYLKNNKCSFLKKEIYSKNIYSYICDKEINMKTFKNIEFYSHELDYSFIFKQKELFVESKDKLIFIICFTDSLKKEWSFGNIFLQKYTIVFEQDRKLIGFYKQKEFSFSYSWIIVISLGIVIISLIYYIYILLKKKRKIRANELIENFEYISKE